MIFESPSVDFPVTNVKSRFRMLLTGEMQKVQHDHNQGDDQQHVDESAGDPESQPANPEEQKNEGDNEEHAEKSGLAEFAAVKQKASPTTAIK
jgi:hypothetical protein